MWRTLSRLVTDGHAWYGRMSKQIRHETRTIVTVFNDAVNTFEPRSEATGADDRFTVNRLRCLRLGSQHIELIPVLSNAQTPLGVLEDETLFVLEDET